MQLQNLFIPLLIVLFAIPLVLQARKQKRTMQEQQKLQKSIEAGDRVMTTSGLFGTVVDTDEDNIELEISPGFTTTWLRQAIREKVQSESDSAEDSESSEDVDDTAAESSSERSSSEQGSSEQSESSDETGEEATSGASASGASGASGESGAEVATPIEEQKTT